MAMTVDYKDYVHDHDRWLTLPSYPLEPDFGEAEYRLRLERARALMAGAHLDALVITSGLIGHWFTSLAAPNEWHDRCQSRSAHLRARRTMFVRNVARHPKSDAGHRRASRPTAGSLGSPSQHQDRRAPCSICAALTSTC